MHYTFVEFTTWLFLIASDVICSNCHKIEHSSPAALTAWEVKRSLQTKEDFLGQHKIDS